MLHQRSRRWICTTAGAVTFAVGVGAVLAAPVAAQVFTTAREVPYAELRTGGDVEVFMADGATKAETERVRSAIRGTHAVERFTLIDDAVARREFRRVFADRPRLRRAASRAAIPTSFRVDFAEPFATNRWMRRVEKLPGVRQVTNTGEKGTDGAPDVLEVVAGCVAIDYTNEVFMKLDASADQVEVVRQALAQQPGISRFEFVSKEKAYAEFRKLLAREPQLAGSTDADDLPTSFRFTVDSKGAPPVNTDALQALPGVDTVTDLERLCTSFGIALPAR